MRPNKRDESEAFQFFFIAAGFGSQYPSRKLSNAIVKVIEETDLEPMFDEIAAPETAITVARSSLVSSISTSLVSEYPVASLPTRRGVNEKNSALRPRRLR